jgi:hypothetical protein
METKVLLNGHFVEPQFIDPAKHRFIGNFRFPTCPDAAYKDEKTGETRYCDAVQCGCGNLLWDKQSVHDHYLMGHFDKPQYVDIEITIGTVVVKEGKPA